MIDFERSTQTGIGSSRPILPRMLTSTHPAVCLTLNALRLATALLGTAGLAAEEKPLRLTLTGQALIQHDLRVATAAKMAALQEALRGADVVFTNLETVIDTGAGRPTRNTQFFHAAKPAVLDCLFEAGFNLLALGNNHSWDLGADGVRATIAEVKTRRFVHAGTGEDLAAASAPAVITTPRGRVALVAFASGKIAEGGAATAERAGVNEVRLGADGEIDPVDAARVFASIRNALGMADLVLVYQHDHYWEADNRITPAWKQRFARACIDAGAGLFVSHGAPLLHGIELYRGRPIFYDLGGLVFHTITAPGHYLPEVWESVIADVEFTAGRLTGLRLRPVSLNEYGEGELMSPQFKATRGTPSLATGEAARSILERIIRLSAASGTKFTVAGDVAVLELPASAHSP